MQIFSLEIRGPKLALNSDSVNEKISSHFMS